MEDAIKSNAGLIKSYESAEQSEDFWNDYLIGRDFEQLSNKYLIPAMPPKRNLTFLRRRISKYRFLFRRLRLQYIID